MLALSILKSSLLCSALSCCALSCLAVLCIGSADDDSSLLMRFSDLVSSKYAPLILERRIESSYSCTGGYRRAVHIVHDVWGLHSRGIFEAVSAPKTHGQQVRARQWFFQENEGPPRGRCYAEQLLRIFHEVLLTG